MAGYDPPSFSLGLDLGLDSEPQIAPDKHPTQTPTPLDEDFRHEVMDSDPESRPEPPRILKHLKRGPTTTLTTKTPSPRAVDDDIEDFSSEDDFLKGNNQLPFFFVFVCSLLGLCLVDKEDLLLGLYLCLWVCDFWILILYSLIWVRVLVQDALRSQLI